MTIILDGTSGITYNGSFSFDTVTTIDLGTSTYSDAIRVKSGTEATGNPFLYIKKESANVFTIGGFGTSTEGSLNLVFPNGINFDSGSMILDSTGNLTVAGSLFLGSPLSIAEGGTGVSSAPAAAAQLMGYTSTVTGSNSGITILDNTSSQYQIFTGSTTQNITLPVTSTLTPGWTFHIVNNSPSNLTVYSSGGNIVDTVYPACTMMVTCIATTTTTAADWEYGFTDFGVGITGINSVVRSTSPSISGASLTGTTTLADTSYITNTTSGNAAIMDEWVFRRTTNGAAIGPAIADVFTTPSSLVLEASSVYEITGQVYFLKTTAGTVSWTFLFSSAPTLFTVESLASPVTGMSTSAGITPLLNYLYNQGTTTALIVPSASNLNTGVNHYFKWRGTIQTNASCNLRLRATNGAGTITPLAGSYYSIRKISASTGTFAA